MEDPNHRHPWQQVDVDYYRYQNNDSNVDEYGSLINGEQQQQGEHGQEGLVGAVGKDEVDDDNKDNEMLPLLLMT